MTKRNGERLLRAGRVPAQFAPGDWRGAAFCLAQGEAGVRAARSRSLTAPAAGAQHTEKAIVFLYSKVKDDALSRFLPRGSKA